MDKDRVVGGVKITGAVKERLGRAIDDPHTTA